MNKRIVSSCMVGALLLGSSLSLQGCYGKFAMTKKVYDWNGSLGNKWVNSVVMWGLYIIPVYEIAGAADIIVLNTVEFWTGKNPLAMGPNERETRIATLEGKDYIVTATQNRLDIVPAKGNVSTVSMVFDPAQQAWFETSQGVTHKIAEQEGNQIALVSPDGHREILTR